MFHETALDCIGDIVDAERVVLVTSPGFRRRGVVSRVEQIMGRRLAHVLDTVAPNPSVDDIQALCALDGLRDFDAIIALGGGSSIDTGKALSRVIAHSGEGVLGDDFWESLTPAVRSTVPIYAIPTTAGTGSEVTPTATVWDYKNGVKRSLGGEDLFPRVAVLDPVLTYGMPREVTFSSGLDAVSHAFESIWNKNASPLTVVLATESLREALRALPRLKEAENDIQARHSMMLASLMAGMAISQTKTALSHSISYPLTLKFGILHGVACSFALPEILEFNSSSDDGRLETLATELGFGTVECLGSQIGNLLETTLASATTLYEVLERTPTANLLAGMLAKGRVENNMRSVRMDDLDEIIRRALRRHADAREPGQAVT